MLFRFLSFLHNHAGHVRSAEEDGSKDVAWGHSYYRDVGLKRRACKCCVRNAETPNLVQAKVDLWDSEALHFVACHCCRDSKRHLLEMCFNIAVES